MALRVQDQSPQVREMAEEWPLLKALMGGTAAMRKGGEQFLPRWPNEEEKAYATRLKTATLFPAFRRTVGVMVGKPFAKALTFGDDMPQVIQQLCVNVDLQGSSLHTFASDLMMRTLSMGISGVLVDYPKTLGLVRTVADEQRLGARPYCVLVKHDQVLGWQEEQVNGAVRLKQLRLAEAREVDDGPYGTRCIPCVRVLYPGGWELHQQVDGKPGEYELVDEGITTLDEIPYVPFYGMRTGFMTGVSPLRDLAYLNVKHWQSQSDQDTILHVARVPILAVVGVDDDKWGLSVGASVAVKLPQQGDMKYVEHTGAAIEAGQKSLEALEEQMIQTGAELLVKKPGDRSATESANDAEANKCDLQRISESFEDSLDRVLYFMARWRGEKEGGHVSLFKDFAANNLTDASAQLIKDLAGAGVISNETAFEELQRRGTISADRKWEEEQQRIEIQGPPLGAMTAPDPGNGNGQRAAA
jgi:hypothetical protein